MRLHSRVYSYDIISLRMQLEGLDLGELCESNKQAACSLDHSHSLPMLVIHVLLPQCA